MSFYCFDFHGAYLGHMQDNGALFDSQGRRWAQLGDGDRVRDLAGRDRGNIDAQGSLFDERGACWGYVRGWAHPVSPPNLAAVDVAPTAPLPSPAAS